MERPREDEYAPFYARYVALVPETDILAVLEQQVEEIRRLAASVPAERETHRYAEGKWSVREVLGHLVDGERVFGYRAFCFSRGEHGGPAVLRREPVRGGRPLRRDTAPGARRRARAGAPVEPRSCCAAWSRAEWARVGTASGQPVTVRALAWVMAGHPRHHVDILRERYGVG